MMKAMILAAGLGKRMLPLTRETPKPLIMVRGRPLIEHTIIALADNGFKDIVINVHHHAQQIKNYLADGKRYGVNLYYSEEQELLDTGGGIKHALPLLGDQPFLVVSADIFTTFPFASLQRVPVDLAHLVLVDNPPWHQHGDFALVDPVMSVKSMILMKSKANLNPMATRKAVTKTAAAGEPMLTYANIGVFRPELFADAPTIAAFPLNILLAAAIAQGKVSGEYYVGDWHNIGTPEILKAVNEG